MERRTNTIETSSIDVAPQKNEPKDFFEETYV